MPNIDAILMKLDRAVKLLVDTSPDMDISEFNETPVGQAVSLIVDARELVDELEKLS